MEKIHFHLKHKLRIDWSDLDYFEHVNNVSYFKYIQSARVNYWEHIGLAQMHKETNMGPLLASCKCDFKQPLLYPGNIVVQSRVEFIKNTSFGIHHQILNSNDEVAAEAHDVLVMFDFNTNEKIKFPEVFRDRIEALEKKTH